MLVVLSAVWSFLNSSAGQTLILGPLAALLVQWVRGDKRRERIATIALEAFRAVEPMALKGDGKWKRAIAMIVDALAKEGLGSLSGPEFAAVQAMAERFALGVKPPAIKRPPTLTRVR